MKSRELMAVVVAVVGAIAIQVLITNGVLGDYWALIIQYACIVTISALGLNMIYGFNGLFSLGHMAFYGLGAYASALVTKGFHPATTCSALPAPSCSAAWSPR